MQFDNRPLESMNQMLEADIVYVRDFSQASSMSVEQLKHLALIAHHCTLRSISPPIA